MLHKRIVKEVLIYLNLTFNTVGCVPVAGSHVAYTARSWEDEIKKNDLEIAAREFPLSHTVRDNTTLVRFKNVYSM